MCIFTTDIASVAETKIFARADGTRQILVYEMTFRRGHEMAMILPLPIPAGSPDDAVKFINMHDSYDFFPDLNKLFYVAPKLFDQQDFGGLVLGMGTGTLPVQEVGLYKASFVPTLADFDRLDPRFRLPPDVWSSLPLYADYGFAVFTFYEPLRPKDVDIDAQRARVGLPPQRQPRITVHPMAFSFPRRDPSTLFFPTLHIHDRSVHKQADFDHVLYAQLRRNCEPASLLASRHPWLPPPKENVMPTPKPTSGAAKVLAQGQPIVRLTLNETLDNADTLLVDQ